MSLVDFRFIDPDILCSVVKINSNEPNLLTLKHNGNSSREVSILANLGVNAVPIRQGGID